MTFYFLIYILLIILLQISLVSLSRNSVEEGCVNIQAAFLFQNGGSTVFLSGNEFVKYDTDLQSEAKVGRIIDLGIPQAMIGPEAAFTFDDGRVYLKKGCDFTIFRSVEERERLELLETVSVRSFGLPCNVDALAWHDGVLFAFEGCNIWKYNNVTRRFRIDAELHNVGIPCDLDAAVEWTYGDMLVLKGHQFWLIYGDDVRGPFHTDELNICSWYICGEASWMDETNIGPFVCNGDTRLCPLRLNQVTFAGLHNAGSGFHGGFGFLNCWVRNHAKTILEQLNLGIHHLDIDPSISQCGLLGSFHNFACGGPICKIIKDVRTFMGTRRHEVVLLNFNHEIQDAARVFRMLTRQLQTQVGPLLNNKYRRSQESRWPTLRQSIWSNKRIFVFYAPIISDHPHNRIYNRNKWIHTEYWLGNTWRDMVVFTDCSGIVPMTEDRCNVKSRRELLEVSIIPRPGSCISSIASACRPHIHAALQACQDVRFEQGSSPNVVMVDYPEINSDSFHSVIQAVYHQNLRNIRYHRMEQCPVKIDAAVYVQQRVQIFFFVGNKIVVHDVALGGQTDTLLFPGIEDVDAAMVNNSTTIQVYKGCEMWTIDIGTLSYFGINQTICQPLDAALQLNHGTNYYFRGCTMKAITGSSASTQNLAALALPCNVDAAFAMGPDMLVFKGNNYWRYNGTGTAEYRGLTLDDWSIDAVRCA